MDRKRINRWTRWFAIIMAIVFALGTVFLGVGSYTGNTLLGCAKKETTPTANSSFADRENYYKDLINQNPQDKDSILILANMYADSQVGRYGDAITYYNQYLALAPNSVDVMLLLGRAQLQNGDNEAAYKTLTTATQVAPNNADAFFMLGQAAVKAGHNASAVNAWNQVLVINPNYPGASDLKAEIAKLVALPPESPPPTTAVPGVSGTSGSSAPAGSSDTPPGSIPFPSTP